MPEGSLQPPPSAFQYESKSRVSAEAALRHPYFRSLGERVHQLEDSECEGEAGGTSLDPGTGQWVCVRREQSPEPRAQVWLSNLAPCPRVFLLNEGSKPSHPGAASPTEGVPSSLRLVGEGPQTAGVEPAH